MNTTRTCTALDLLAVRWRYKASSMDDRAGSRSTLKFTMLPADSALAIPTVALVELSWAKSENSTIYLWGFSELYWASERHKKCLLVPGIPLQGRPLKPGPLRCKVANDLYDSPEHRQWTILQIPVTPGLCVELEDGLVRRQVSRSGFTAATFLFQDVAKAGMNSGYMKHWSRRTDQNRYSRPRLPRPCSCHLE